MKTGVRLGMLLGALCLCACVSGGESVVGRSAVERPAWVEGDVDGEPQNFVWLVYKKPDIYRLELGMKQAQVAAVAAVPKLLRERILADLWKIADRALGTIPAQQQKPAIEVIFAKVPVTRESPDAFPARTYHEEIRRDSDTGQRISYDVFVLVSVSRQDYILQMQDTMRRMLASENAELRKVGIEIQKEFSPEQSSQN
jgi:hypothetical protein